MDSVALSEELVMPTRMIATCGKVEYISGMGMMSLSS